MLPRDISQSVARVIEDVRRRGDEALLEYTRRWDAVQLTADTLRVSESSLSVPPADSDFTRALRRAVQRIRRFHLRVRPRSTIFEDEDGAILGMRWTPIRSVGLYVPGGKASYPSTLAMTAIPAQIAGVERIVVVSPPGPDGEVSPQVLLAARLLGLDELYRAGGAQAIAALAFGTETIPRVDKIFGPGNAFVAEAKKQLFGEVGIDLVAGPSEVVVYADDSADPDWIAADLMAQAEHDEAACVTFLAASTPLMEAVRSSLERLVVDEPRRATIETSIRMHGVFEVVGDEKQAADRINEIAPEHLTVQIAEPWKFLPLVRNSGAIYLGKESSVAMGDYYLGPNHVLPTGSTARFASCLSVEDFMKRSNLACINMAFLRRHGEHVEELAFGERLPAHATSVRLRRSGSSGLRARPGIRSVTPYAIVEEQAEVKLNQNECPWDIPAEIKDEVARRLRDLPWNRYHQKQPAELLRRIAEDSGHPVGGILAASGSNLLLQWIFEAYIQPGSAVVFPEPSFALYRLWAEVTEARVHAVSLRGDMSYDVDAFLAAIREEACRLAVLCLPNNPTGSEMEVAAVQAIARAARDVGALLVIDEAYREFSDPRLDRSELAREHDNIVLVRTCSKAFAAAGMRLGYALAPPAVAEELRKIVPPFHLSLFSAVLGQVLWERKDLFDARVQKLVEERDRMMAAVRGLPGIEVYPSWANFFMFRLEGAERVYEGLQRQGILVRRPAGGGDLAHCLRVNVGTSEENQRFLEALEGLVGV
ncbi:MAG: histidinol dehydrogenase [Planctomycetes bacterium]|nr:histidinol dehydrogenase [Planctomycetota bacterium]